LGPTRHVLDWFHLSMRIQHVAQTAKGWPDASAGYGRTGAGVYRAAGLADAIERIRWRLWHGQVKRALDLIGETLVMLGMWPTLQDPRSQRRRGRADCRGILADPLDGPLGVTPMRPGRGLSGIRP
jgi:hypothetical protein